MLLPESQFRRASPGEATRENPGIFSPFLLPAGATPSAAWSARRLIPAGFSLYLCHLLAAPSTVSSAVLFCSSLSLHGLFTVLRCLFTVFSLFFTGSSLSLRCLFAALRCSSLLPAAPGPGEFPGCTLTGPAGAALARARLPLEKCSLLHRRSGTRFRSARTCLPGPGAFAPGLPASPGAVLPETAPSFHFWEPGRLLYIFLDREPVK